MINGNERYARVGLDIVLYISAADAGHRPEVVRPQGAARGRHPRGADDNHTFTFRVKNSDSVGDTIVSIPHGRSLPLAGRTPRVTAR